MSKYPFKILCCWLCIFGIGVMGGCQKMREVTRQALRKTTHDKFGWKAPDFFEEAAVIELCKAIEDNDLQKMKQLIDSGVDVNARGKGNMTPLLWAFLDNKIERLKLLLDAGADPNVYITSDLGVPSAFTEGDAVTHMACKSTFAAFEHVFAAGGDPNLPSKNPRVPGYTPIFTVIKSGGPDVKKRVKILLDLGAEINQREPKKTHERTPVMVAAGMFGQYDVALFLLQQGADPAIYQKDFLFKLTHTLAGADGILNSAGPKQKADYRRLVDWLEENGESVEEARKDIARHRFYIDNHHEVVRKKLFREEAERNRKRYEAQHGKD